MAELALRFLIGGLVVSAFAVLGDMLKPKSFAGIFGAAPSVALASLALSVGKHGTHYGAVEARSMVIGAFGFLAYSVLGFVLVKKLKWAAMPAMLACMPIWFVLAFTTWHLAGGAA